MRSEWKVDPTFLNFLHDRPNHGYNECAIAIGKHVFKIVTGVRFWLH